ncbi:chorismate mutase [Burkholderia lata]|uniref:Chorismate mutase n=2 Tax=Burkholderia lata (strain ATCC 17760 / DSM 23089 / LMG 22485 / NCIMB 9086 / R18194 / 383) TaxID=482957 RepID=A0A6P2GWP3_BURL3|nr:chorismate mutase [Burkholderia lata]
MGAITPRINKDGTTSYKAQVRVRKAGKVLHQETKTFSRRQAAVVWMKKREAELTDPAGLKKALAEDPPLRDILKRAREETKKPMSTSKTNVLKMMEAHDFSLTVASQIDSAALVKFISGMNVSASTGGNYFSHLASVLKIARPAWGYPIAELVVEDARIVLRRMGVIARSVHRDRRPTIDEMNRLMDYFSKSVSTRGDTVPMTSICLMSIFSIRRSIEICGITWNDFDEEGARVLVRDLKHPDEKIGNDTWCALTPEAIRVIKAQPKIAGESRIFPYAQKSASMAFTNAALALGIEDLTLNDLRHEGCSRLAEMGWSIPKMASVSGHRSWQTLKRYTHVRATGDKWNGWEWLDRVAPQAAS